MHGTFQQCLHLQAKQSSRKGSKRAGCLKCFATASQYEQQDSPWFSAAGIRCPKAKLASVKGLRGMFATDDVVAKEMIASVPHASALVLEPAMKCPFPSFCSPEYWKKVPWFVRLGLMLLYEKHIEGSSSRHIRYLEDLAAIRIETPLVWSDSERADLHYPWLQAQIGKQIEQWTDLHTDFQESASCNVDVSKGDFFWALQAVRSRAFSGPYGGFWSLQIAHLPIEQVLNAGIAAVLFNIIYDLLMSKKLKRYALLPVIDYMNHSATVESDVSYEVFRDRFTASTNTAFKEGEELKVSYGRHNNDYLLQFFGFFIPDLGYDSYTISTEGQSLPDGTALPEQVILTRNGPSSATRDWLKQCRDQKAGKEAIISLCEAEKKRWLSKLSEDRKQSRLLADERRLLACHFRIEKKSLLEICMTSLRR